MNVIGAALVELYRCFDIINDEKFNSDLPRPVITIQKGKKNVLGHFTLDKVWVNKADAENGVAPENTPHIAYHELNLDPCHFDRPVEEIIGTLIHEMCHYANRLAGIKDCSGRHHNKKFKVLAEEIGFIVEKGKGVGYGYTTLSDELREFVLEVVCPDDSVFEYFRAGIAKDDKGDSKKERNKTMFKFTCPQCGQVAKAKNGVVIKCGYCDIGMDIEEGYELVDVNDKDEDDESVSIDT